MSAVGVVSILLGLLIAVSRTFLVLFPAATLRWTENLILQTEKRTRTYGICVLPVPGLMIWAGASEESGLAAALLIFGLFMLAAIPWLVFFPRSFMEFCGMFLPPDVNSRLIGWRVIGMLGLMLSAVLIYLGWRAL